MPPVTEEPPKPVEPPKVEEVPVVPSVVETSPKAEAPKAQTPDWMNDIWVPELPVVEAPAKKKKKAKPAAQTPAAPAVASSPAAPAEAPSPAAPAPEQAAQKPEKKKKKKKGKRLVAVLLILAIVLGLGGWLFFGWETVYVVTSAEYYNADGTKYQEITYQYDHRGNLLKYQQDGDWDVTGRVDGEPDHTVTYQYDSDGRITRYRSQNSSGYTSSYRYKYKEKNGRVTEITKTAAWGDVVYTLHYNARKQLVEICEAYDDEEKTIAEFSYDGLGRMTQCCQYGDHDGCTKYAFTYQKGHMTTIEIYRKADEDARWGEPISVSTCEYGSFGRLLSITTEADEETVNSFEYDSKGNLIYADLGGTKVNFEYDGRKPVSAVEKDDEGYETEYIYDEHGNLKELTEEDGISVRYTYKRMWLTKKDAALYYENTLFYLEMCFDRLISWPELPTYTFKKLLYGGK